ncbi:hypothetical protein DCAR_0104137 [Daucus carota subsp. sativus]|uniref:ATP-dependent DNA helicase n=1 Tax=Daucus carota subsp. sativus TaxID=79200 RepID=A0AAF0W8U5_DAUCS|nr:hypothetical protein DCAR_0104137 [Daucus carota subsp. sativus]
MQHRYSFECLDRSLKDIMKAVDPRRYHMPFGGITVVLGGDFRQILPVIPQAPRGEIVAASITRSKLWKIATVFKLLHNMRLNKGRNNEEIQNLKEFAQWVLDIGDGKIGPPPDAGVEYGEDDIAVPERYCNMGSENSVEQMMKTTFPSFLEKFQDPNYLSDRAILTPTNVIVGEVNSVIVDRIPGNMSSFFSIDTAEDYPGTAREQMACFPPEYLNALNIPGLPLHELKLKVGVVVMLMRNLNQTLGLCNGTRMMVTLCLQFCVFLLIYFCNNSLSNVCNLRAYIYDFLLKTMPFTFGLNSSMVNMLTTEIHDKLLLFIFIICRATKNVTFFNEYGDSFLEAYKAIKETPVIIIITFAKVTDNVQQVDVKNKMPDILKSLEKKQYRLDILLTEENATQDVYLTGKYICTKTLASHYRSG